MKNTLKMIALATIVAFPALQSAPSQAKPGDDGAKGGKMDGRRGGMRGGGMRGGGGMMRRMEKDLGITAAQKAKMEAVMKDSGTKRRAIRENKSLSEAQRKAQMKALRTSTEARMKAILTPAQRTKFAAMQSQWEKRRAENGGPRGPR